MAFRTIGKTLPRIEGDGKVTGQTKYAADLPFPEDLLWAKVLRASVPHARIVNIDTSKAKALKGVHAVLTGADVKDIYVGTRVKDQPVLAYDKVRMGGDAVAAVAADSEEIAEEAIGLIDVQYEELPYVEDPVEALKPSAPLIHEDRNKYKNAPKLPEGVIAAQPAVLRVVEKRRRRSRFSRSGAGFRAHIPHAAIASRLYRALRLHGAGSRRRAGRSVGVEQRALGFARADGGRFRRAAGENQDSYRPRRRRLRRQGVVDRRAGGLLSIEG